MRVEPGMMKVVLWEFLLMVGGCATLDYEPSYVGTDGPKKLNFEKYVKDCNRVVQAQHPPKTVLEDTGEVRYRPGETNCSTYKTETRCTSIPGTYIKDQWRVDLNEPARHAAFNKCMSDSGYQLVK